METRPQTSPAWYQQFVTYTCLFSIFFALLSLAGMVAESLMPVRVIFTWLYLQPNVAICFILCGWILYLLQKNSMGLIAKMFSTSGTLIIFFLSCFTLL